MKGLTTNCYGRIAHGVRRGTTGAGVPYWAFTLRVHDEREGERTWLRVSAYGDVAEGADTQLASGVDLRVEGALRLGRFRDRNGVTKERMVLTASLLEVVDELPPLRRQRTRARARRPRATSQEDT